MVRHIVMWNFKPELSAGEKRENAQKIKISIENLKNIIEGITEIKVYTPFSGNRDIILDSTFTSKKALEDYITHPEHIKAGELVRAVTQDRASADFEI